MNELVLGRALVAYIEAGVPADVDLSPRIARAAGRRRRPRSRLGWAVIAAAAAALAGTAVAYAVGGENFPTRLRLLPAAAPAVHVDKSRLDAGRTAPKPPTTTAGTKAGAPATTTLAAAEQGFGAHVLTVQGLAGAALGNVYFKPSQPLPPDAKPGSHELPNTVVLIYRYAGTSVEVTETMDAGGGSLTVDAVDANGPKLKSGQGLGPAAIEQVGGSDYVVGRTTDGSRVEWVIWKTSSGTVVSVHFDNGVSHQQAFGLATHVR